MIMKNVFKLGDTKEFIKEVTKEDLAFFTNDHVHEVYSTFALGRDAEWCCRLFVLEMKETHEEGIGTFLKVVHHSPALLGQSVKFVATIDKLEKNEIVCTYVATVEERVVASGEQGQKIISKERLTNLFEQLR